MRHGGARKGTGRPGTYGEKTKPIRLPLSLIPSVQKFVANKGYKLPLFASKVPAGFPSPAEDFIADSLDLNEYLIKHPAATFFVRVSGHSMINAGIFENDILIIDRSIQPGHGKIVVVAIDGQLTVKRLHKLADGKFILMAENPDFQPIEVKEESTTCIWGVVTNVIHSV